MERIGVNNCQHTGLYLKLEKLGLKHQKLKVEKKPNPVLEIEINKTIVNE